MAASLQLSACANYSLARATPNGSAETTILIALEQPPNEAATIPTPTPFAVNIRNFDVGLDQYCGQSRSDGSSLAGLTQTSSNAF